MEFKDRQIICKQCWKPFTFSAGEQLFFAQRQFLNDPKTCKPCRADRSTVKIETAAKCARCGEVAIVPFKATQGRPVFCRACFSVQN